MDWKTFVFSPNGRISRKQFWLHYALIYIAISFAIMFILSPVATIAASAGDTAGLVTTILLGVVILLFYIVGTWWSICASTKRLHDRNMSGWWQLVPFVILVVAFLPGNRGPNRFGMDPLGDAHIAEDVFS